MISSVAQSGFSNPSGGTALNTAQSESLLALLSNYNPKNITKSDAQEIVSGIREIGIKAGKGLGELLNQTGFQPRELAQKAGVLRGAGERPPPPPEMSRNSALNKDGNSPSKSLSPNSTSDISSNDALASLTRLVEKYEGHVLSDDDWTRLYSDLESEGIDVSKPLLDILL